MMRFYLLLLLSLSAISMSGEKRQKVRIIYHGKATDTVLVVKNDVVEVNIDNMFPNSSRITKTATTATRRTTTTRSHIASPTPVSRVSSGQCIATTKKGTRCKRKAQPGSNYCWQHR